MAAVFKARGGGLRVETAIALPPPPGGLFCGGGSNVSWVHCADGNATSTTPPGEGFGRHDGLADIVMRELGDKSGRKGAAGLK